MSVILVCSSCQAPLALSAPLVSAQCTRCGATFAADVLAVASRELAGMRVPRPFLLTLGMGFVGLWATVVVLIFLFYAFSEGPFLDNGVLVRKSDFFRSSTTQLFAGLALYCGGVAYGLWRDRAWVQHFMFLAWPMLVIAGAVMPMPSGESRAPTILLSIVLLLVGAWYLYRKVNVVAYFAQRRVEAPPTGRI